VAVLSTGVCNLTMWSQTWDIVIHYTTLCHVTSVSLSPTAYSLGQICCDEEAHAAHLPRYYSNWISKWLLHLNGAPDSIKDPPEATRICAPLVPEQWQRHLADNPDQQFLLLGLLLVFDLAVKFPCNSHIITQEPVLFNRAPYGSRWVLSK